MNNLASIYSENKQYDQAERILLRGIKYIQIPTTLLAQVDSSIGGKTGINTIHGKNLVGSFNQPVCVLTDFLVLDTLDTREIISGYGEILKHSLISDRKFFFWLTKNGKKIVIQKNSLFGLAETKIHLILFSFISYIHNIIYKL